MKKTFIISPVKNLTPQVYAKLLRNTEKLETKGYEVYLPARDTDQKLDAFAICSENFKAIQESAIVHIWFDPESVGSVFDLGVVFSLNKPLRLLNYIEPTPEKSFANLVIEYAKLWER